MKRLFLAADLNPAARDRIRDIVEALQDRIGTSRGDRSLKLAWVSPANWHVTMHFLGGVDDQRVSTLLDVLAKSLPAGAI